MNHLKDPGKTFLAALPDDAIEQALERTASAIASANITRSTFMTLNDDEFDQLAVEQDIDERDLTTAFLYWSIFSAEPIKLHVTALPAGMGRLSDLLAHFVPMSPLSDILKLAA